MSTHPPPDVPAFVFWLMPDEDPLFEEWPSSTLLRAWQRGRCAMCQVTDWFDSQLVMDHSHETGKICGLLCRGCNSAEPHSGAPAFTAWRAGLNPATALGIDEWYHSPVTGRARPRAAVSDDTLDAIAEAMV